MSYLLHQLLERAASRYPDNKAVVYKGREATYRELEELSNGLARILCEGGVRRGDRVGIYLNKSVESIVAVFGILKAGAVYVPLDPLAPLKRLSYIVQNCGIRGLVATGEKLLALADALPERTTLETAVLADPDASGAPGVPRGLAVARWSQVRQRASSSSPGAALIEDDLAYVLYTSGSTGEPKGVMISHRASLTFVNWAHRCFGVTCADRVSNHAPLHFDLSVLDIFAAVKAGAAILPVPEELSAFPRDLADFIERERISIWYSVPSVLSRMVLHGDLKRHRFSKLRTVLFAGEVFPVKYLRELMERIPHAAFYNLYGPTETNVCTYYPVPPLSPERVEPIPIGKPCANTEVFVVGEQREPVSAGEAGELLVRGPSLMKGYWGMAEKTQLVLVPQPAHGAGERVYRTGDLVQQDPDGNYLFLGRRDSMIKSRGYRIELGEIESALYSHPSVQEVAAVPIPDELLGNIIKAVVVLREGCEATSQHLKAFCSERIPKYMTPAEIEFRPSLPKTSTGKVDKTLLRQELDRGA